jgi:antitoxin (DNA-binding transcriptional repressor) of toxin-antitoxin stability system
MPEPTRRPSRMVDTDHLMSVSDANSKGVSWLASTAAQGFPTVLMRSGKPVAAVVPLDAYYAFMAAQATEQNDPSGGPDG